MITSRCTRCVAAPATIKPPFAGRANAVMARSSIFSVRWWRWHCRGQPSGPSPACVPPGLAAAMPVERSPRSGASDRDGDELHRVIRLQPHQHDALAILMGIDDGIAHIRRGRDFLAAHVEDDIAGLEAVFGCEPVG